MSMYQKIPTFATPEDSVDHPFPIDEIFTNVHNKTNPKHQLTMKIHSITIFPWFSHGFPEREAGFRSALIGDLRTKKSLGADREGAGIYIYISISISICMYV